MALLFEYCFYAGLLLAVLGSIWLVVTLVRGPRSLAMRPIWMLLLAGALVLGPAVITRTMAVDLGPREKIVSNERHISLTGWDGEGYVFLKAKPDTVVLQMGNQDVNDGTLDFLASMNQLRELDLNESSVTDAGIAKLSKLPSLETLRLRGTKITDAGFRQHLMHAPALKQIDLRGTAVSQETVDLWKSDDELRRAFH